MLMYLNCQETVFIFYRRPEYFNALISVIRKVLFLIATKLYFNMGLLSDTELVYSFGF